MEIGSDIFFENLNMPGAGAIAERKRAQLLQAGVIPENQLSDEEKEQIMAAQNQPKEMSATDQAALALSEAELERAVANTQDILSKIAERDSKIELKSQELMMKQEELMVKMQTDFELKMAEVLNKQADTLNKIKSAIGADTVPGREQAGIVLDTQRNVAESTE